MLLKFKIGILLFTLIILTPVISNAAGQELNGKLINGIGISGNYPYIEGRIRRYLTVRPSDYHKQEIIGDQIRRIKEFYSKEGWIGTEVSVKPEYKPETDSVYLHVKIKKGYLLRYRNTTVTGDYRLPVSLVASKINTWKNYTPRRLRESIHKITHSYRMAGYPLARVRVTQKNADLEAHRIDITVNIESGPYVGVEFVGNEHLGGKQLKKVITIFNEGAIDSFELEESVKAIQKRYTLRGFPNVTAKFTRDELSNDKIIITFFIDEGIPERIREIDFKGNDHFRAGKIDAHIQSKSLSFFHPGIYDKRVLTNDLKRIDLFYQSKGFPDARVLKPDIEKLYGNTQLVIDIPVEEGVQYIIKDISFGGDIPFPVKKLLKALRYKPDKPLDFTIKDEELLNLKSFYADRGYPYAEVSLNIDEDSAMNTASLNFTIKSGPVVRFGKITFVGDFITSQKAMHKAITVRDGDLFSYEQLVNSKIALRRLGAFASADIIMEGIEDKATVIPLIIKVEEMRPFVLDFDIGFSTDERFVGGINFINRNSFGWAKRTYFELLGGRRLSRAEIGWVDPRFAGYDLEMSAAGWSQYENKEVFNYVQSGVGIGFYRKYHRTSFGVKTNLNRNYFLKGSSTAADAESLRNNTIFNTLLSMSFDTRNNFADPTKGTYTYGYSNFFNEVKGNEAHFVKLGIMGGVYFTLGGLFTVANDARFENIQTFGKDMSVPSNELYLLGGDDTLRGFSRDSLGPVNAQGKPTGGRLRFVCNNELRIKLIGNFKWVVFHDMGFLTNAYSAVTTGTLRHSIGFGLHYITPIGPIKADYGFIIDRRPGEHMGRLHLTFGYIF